MALISLNAARKFYGAFQALDEATFTVGTSEKVALVGPNGSGKTTILRLIAALETPDSGAVSVLPGATIGYVQQDSELTGQEPLLSSVSGASSEVRRLEAEMRDLEGHMARAEPDEMDALVSRYGEVQHEYERLGGYAFEAEVKATLTGLGLGAAHWDKPVNVLSGGQKTRAALARVLLQKPDALLLDEPTNHLDIEATEWLEEFLQGFSGAVLVVSHDRYFLDRVVTKVVDLQGRIAHSYPGNYTAFAKLKQERERAQEESYERQQEEIHKMEDFILRYKAGQRSKQARGREKLLGRMERVERPKQKSTLNIAIEPLKHSGRSVLDLKSVTKSFGAEPLFRNLDLSVDAGERIGLVGPNGAGKTTLIRIILGKEAADSGSVSLGCGVETGYFAQDLTGVSEENSVLEELLDSADLTPAQARNMLAQFLFKGDDVFKAMASLSGGERNRVALAKLMVSRPNLLILDEPTNHLDIDSREALGEALQSYSGTVILISHDRYLLNSIATRIVEISSGNVRSFLGNYDEYAQQAHALRPRVSQKKKAKPPTRRQAPGKKKGSSPEKIEREIESAEARISELAGILSRPETFADHESSAAILAEHEELESRIRELYRLWEEALL
ncbi:MAG: ABC-F family ATP-binding cassette domain-containing protein [Armatimonadetes bacterium]|nr:ABC-F family ATP-binding cassette domain-containing protein [Armatimonadota bacterium]